MTRPAQVRSGRVRRSRELELVPYAPELEEAIVAFNRRLAAARAPGEFRLQTRPGGPAPPATSGVFGERYLALEGDVVRGGVFLQVQPFDLHGETCRVANIQLPLSEGVVDRRYAHVGMWLVKQVLRRYPRCFALGMGGLDRPLPRLLGIMGFAVSEVPFYFRVANATRAARELPALGPPRVRRIGSALVRATGAGAATSAAWRGAAAWRTRGVPRPEIHPVEEWGPWADRIWDGARASLAVAAVRDARTLPALLPADDARFPSFRLEHGGRNVGWVTVGVRRMVASPHFGGLTVGTVVDGLTLPGHEAAAIRAATALAVERGAEIVVTNQAHPAWREACRRAAFASARSNYVLATSPAFLAGESMHFTRGDGDGRVHL